MKKLVLLVQLLLLTSYYSFGQVCLGNPSVSGQQNICPGNYYTYTSSASIGFPYRFDYVDWSTNTGNALTKINGTDARTYARDFVIKRDLSASDITLIENYYPTRIYFKTIGLDNDEVTFYYNQPGFSQSVKTSILPSKKTEALPRSVEVYFGNRYYNVIDYKISRRGLFGRCDYTDYKTLNTQRTFNPNDIQINNPTNLPTCSSGGNFEIRESGTTLSTSGFLFNWRLTDPLGTEKNALINGNRNSNNVYISYLDRPGTWVLTCTLATACRSHVFSFPITVANPFALQPAEIRIDGINNGTSVSLLPSCPKAYQSGYQLSVPQYNNIPDLQYTWTLPPGWRTFNAPATSVASVGGLQQFTYTNAFLNSLTMDSYIKNNGTIPGGQGQVVIRACNTVSSPIQLSVVPNGPLDVRLNPQVTSCLPSITLEPVVLVQSLPATITWQTVNGGSWSSATTDVFTPGNTFTASPGTYQVRLFITDNRQCSSDFTNSTIVMGGPSVTSAGWNSGVLSDVNNWNVISNLSVTDNLNVYFAGQDRVSGATGIFYYRFEPTVSKWLPSPVFPQPNNGVRSGTNAVATAPGTAFGLYYVDVSNNIRRLTATSDLPVFGGLNADLIKVDPAGTLNTAKVVYHNSIDNFIYSWDPVTPSSISKIYVNFLTKYDIGINSGRVFYVNTTESALYYKELSDNNQFNKGIPLTSLYTINCYTDIQFDAAGNVYFAQCDGGIYVCKKNATGYDAPISVQIPSARGCDGRFTINTASGTLYYTGYDNRVYQHFVVNFSTNQWGNVPATQSFGDLAGRSLVFKAPHLFYIGDNNLVYNLYYFEGCTPSPLRMIGEDSDHIPSPNQIYTAGNGKQSTTAGKTFPNPFNEQFSLIVEGSGSAVLKIQDVNGRVVMKEEYQFEERSITTSDWTQGMYICTVEQNGQIIYSTKLIKQ